MARRMRWASPPDSDPALRLQAEIAHAHRFEKAQPLSYLLEHPGADQLLPRGQLQFVQELGSAPLTGSRLSS